MMNKNRRTAFIALVLLAFLSNFSPRTSAQDAAESRPLDISTDRYLETIRYLASDELAGRLPGTPGGNAASEYIAAQFKALGLRPAGVDGTYFQPFTIEGRKQRHDETAVIRLNDQPRDWKIGKDWIPLPFSQPGEFSGPLAFAGYGISAAKFDYDDYADFDARGKVLIVLRQEPKAEDAQADFGGEIPSLYALFSKKASLAAKHGAVALLIVNPSDRDGEKDELYPWYDWDTSQTYALPLVQITRQVANELLGQANLPDITQLQSTLDRERKSLSADLVNSSVHVDTGLRYIEGRNVLGMLQGNGDTDETIVIGAHHDHVGNVPDDDGVGNVPVIHNGADDNASGTTGVLELAHALVAAGPCRRNILFMTFDGEEFGLLGSDHFVENPTVPLDKIRAMINLDMIGRLNQDQFTIYGVGSAKEFRELLNQSAEQLKLKFRAPSVNAEFFGASDHHSFYRKNIPVLFLFTNIHKQYHRAKDDWELVDVDGACRILNMIEPIIVELANMPDGPAFIPADQEERPEGEDAETHGGPDDPFRHGPPPELDGPSSNSPPRASLRLIPDHSYAHNDGVRVLSVLNDGPAQTAGIQVGDLIVRIGEESISDVRGYMEALMRHEPNQTVEITIKRGENESTFQVTLVEARRGRKPKPNPNE